MRKLFTLAAAVLASFSLWAVDPTVEILNTNFTQWKEGATPPENSGLSNKNTYTLTDGTNDVASVVGSGCKLNDTKNTPTAAGITGYNTNKFRFGSSGNYLYITPSANFVDGGKVRILVSAEQTSESKILGTVYIGETNLGNLHGWTAKATCDWQEFDIPETVDGSAQLKLTRTDNTMFVWGIQILTNKDCTDPEATIIADKDIFVGDATDLGFETLNTSEVVWTVKKGDAVAAAADYTLAEGVFTAINAGVYTITATQEADGTHCEVEVGVTLNASQKAKVTSFEIEGATTAHIGEEVTLTAKNFDAAPETISWTLNEEVVSTTTSYTFTPDAAGTYAFTISASNQFNETAATVNHTVVVAVGTDATLSDLKVNGTTVEGFDAATLSYNIGELGIYEALAVTATAADAPYANAEVVDDEAGTVTITVTAEDKSTKVYTITYSRAAATELVAIEGDATWDFTKTGSSSIQFTDETMIKKGVTEFNFADVLSAPDASFNAAALNGIGEYAVREGKYFQGGTLKFETTVPGKLEVIYSNTGNRDADKNLERILTVNGTKIGAGALRSDKDVTESDIAITAGEVIIKSVLKADDTEQYIRVKKVTFTATRFEITCNTAENGTIEANATEAIPGTVVTLTVTPNEGYQVSAVTVNGEAIEAVEGAYSFTMPAANVNVTATFSAIDYTITCNTAENGTVTADKAKANIGETVTLTVTPDEGYKVSAVTVNGEAIEAVEGAYSFTMPAANVNVTATFVDDQATAIDNTNAAVKAVKVLRDGQLFIEKNGKTYNALGQFVR